MGVKSTITLTRREAVQRAADHHERKVLRAVEAHFHAMSDEELENPPGDGERLHQRRRGI